MPLRLVDRLNKIRHQQFVGREEELALFRSVLTASELSFFVLYIFGPGGIGKTSLLREYVYLCQQTQISATYVDMREVQLTPLAFVAVLQTAMGLSPLESPLEKLAAQTERHIILIDTYETVASLGEWLRAEFLPQLSAQVFVVIAGRDTSSLAWQFDAGWRDLVQTVALRNLEPDESIAFLTKRQVSPQHHQPILDFTHGHPLALSLIADEFAQHQDKAHDFKIEADPDIIKALLNRFIQKVPSPLHRTALEACAQVRWMNEALLAEMLAIPDAHDIFEWLRSLSFVEAGRHGLFLHELAGKILALDLRWRNPELNDELRRRARTVYATRLRQGDPTEQQRTIVDSIYLHRHSPVVQPFFKVSSPGSVRVESGQTEDWSALIAMVARHEGRTSATIAKTWLDQQPDNVIVVRSFGVEGEPDQLGFLLLLDLEEASQKALTTDPATQAAWNYLQKQAPLRAGEKATYFRFWLGHDTYQNISPVQALIGVEMVRHYLTTPNLAFTFFPCANPDFWAPLAAYANLRRIPDADFVVDDRQYGVFGHDWRIVPPLQWLDMMAGRDTMRTEQPPPPLPANETLLILSQAEFRKAVRDLLRNYSNTEALRTNPLLRSRLVVKSTEVDVSEEDRINRLQDLVKTATEGLRSSPRQAKLFRALYRTYLNPALTQEKTAEVLDLPFSTYRRHLNKGINEVTNILWQQEIGGSDKY